MTDLVDSGRRAVRKTIEIKKSLPDDMRIAAARLEILVIRDALARKVVRDDQFAHALEYLPEDGLDGAAFVPLHGAYAEVLRLRATHFERTKPLVAERDITSGLLSVNKALEKNPRHAQSLVIKAQLLVVRSRLTKDASIRVESARQAQLNFRAAFEANKLLEQEHAAEYREAMNIR